MNQKKFISMILLINFFLISLIFNFSVMNTAITSNSMLSSNIWRLNNWNETETLNFFPTANISAVIGSNVSYNITNVNEGNNTHPNEGVFSIGNLTLATDNPTIGSNLAFSVWPWIPGLVAQTNWTWQINEANIASNEGFLAGSMDITTVLNSSNSYNFNFIDFNRQVIEFNYHQNFPGNQNTTLIYDTETGVLLHGYTELYFDKLYFLELELISSTLITTSNAIELVSSTSSTSSSLTVSNSNTLNTSSKSTEEVSFSMINPIIIFGTIILLLLRKKN